jgi:hypothetical protein
MKNDFWGNYWKDVKEKNAKYKEINKTAFIILVLLFVFGVALSLIFLQKW